MARQRSFQVGPANRLMSDDTAPEPAPTENRWLLRVQRLGGLGLSFLVDRWMRTINYRGVLEDPTCDPGDENYRGPAIFLHWHEYMLIPLYLRSKTGLGILTSRHRDAEWLSQFASMNGFGVYRGSSGRGGVGVLKSIFKQNNFSGLVITPDGPRGPRREMAVGAIFLASKLGVPLVLVGMGFDRPWRNTRAWDHFAIPRPGSRARIMLSRRLFIPPDLDRTELERHRLDIQQRLQSLTLAAETWAASNQAPGDAVPIYPARR